ncbi:MAG TPA: glycosyltransferase family 9 protein, partial [Planctomycetota bacterium]|nr:glycosyltransferase family 9 protein [Planctomycetota bacterium]
MSIFSFTSSIAASAQKFVRTSSPPLVIRFGAIGDMILITPLLRALAERHGRPCDVIGHSRWLPALFRHLPFVGDVQAIDSLNAPYLFEPSKQRVTRWLRERPVGPVYVLQADVATLAMVRRARITPIASQIDLPRGAGEHPVDWYQRLGKFSAPWRRDPELMVSESEMTDCRHWLAQRGLQEAPLVLLQAGNRKTSTWRTSTSDHKIWPVECWAAIARGVLASMPDARVLLIGAPKEHLLARDIETAVGDKRVLAVADQVPLRRLFALQRLAHSLISVDTGPAHAAAALGCPAVVLFGHTDPRAIGPINGLGPCHTVHPHGAPSLTSR